MPLNFGHFRGPGSSVSEYCHKTVATVLENIQKLKEKIIKIFVRKVSKISPKFQTIFDQCFRGKMQQQCNCYE